jgi:hypothetical protein
MPVSVPEALRAAVLKAMAREKEGRYRGVAELAADVDAYVGGFATSAEGAGVKRRVPVVGWEESDVCGVGGVVRGDLPNAKRMAEEKGRRWGCCCRIQGGSCDCGRQILDVIE